MVGGGTVTFVSSPPPLDNLLSRWVFWFPWEVTTFFVTFIKKYHQKRGVFGRLLIQYGTSLEDCLPLFRPRGLERSSFLDKVMAFSRLTFVQSFRTDGYSIIFCWIRAGMDRGVLTIGGPFEQCLRGTYLNGEHFKHGVLFIRGSLNLGNQDQRKITFSSFRFEKIFSPCVQGWR